MKLIFHVLGDFQKLFLFIWMVLYIALAHPVTISRNWVHTHRLLSMLSSTHKLKSTSLNTRAIWSATSLTLTLTMLINTATTTPWGAGRHSPSLFLSLLGVSSSSVEATAGLGSMNNLLLTPIAPPGKIKHEFQNY